MIQQPQPTPTVPTAATTARLRAEATRTRLGGIVLLGLLILCCAALIVSAMSFDNRLRELRDADTDNQGWIVSQLEVDHQALIIAAGDALASAMENQGPPSDEAWRALNTEFDIFYSRVSVFAASMRNFDPSPQLEAWLARMVRTRTDLANQLDTMDPADIDALRSLGDGIRDKIPLVRLLTTQGLQFFVEKAENAREQEREIWRFFLTETLLLLTLIVAAALLSVRLNRALERRTAEAERAASTIVKAYEASLSAVIVTNLDGVVQLCNQTAERMFGIASDEIIGHDVSALLAPSRLHGAIASTYAEFARCIRNKRTCSLSRRTLALRACGDSFPVELAITNDVDPDGQPILICFIRDISAQVSAERALRGALDDARRAAAAKSMFLATMSHEMRTPLHGLIAALELMDKSGFDAENRTLFDTARDCSERALAQVNDVLHFTRATSTREAPTSFRPARVVADVVGELGPFAKDNNNMIELSVNGPGATQQVTGYPAAFSRALYNLVGNAVKFTVAGKITVRLDFTETTPDAPLTLKVSVQDEGPGIAEADQQRIFRMFETSAAQTGVAAGRSGLSGTGLGLPITKLAVETMGGEIHLESAPGQGSRFWFEVTLPRAVGLVDETAPPPRASIAPPSLPPTVAWNILVVDDNEVNLTLMMQMVRRLGHKTTPARNGREAADLARDTAFDVILMDVNMPVMNGCDATRLIRAEGASRHAVILGVTALMEAEDPDSFAEFGMDSALVKPVKPATLAQVLADIAQTITDDLPKTRTTQTQEAPRMDFPTATDTGFDLGALSALVGDDIARRLAIATLKDAGLALEAGRANDPNLGDLAHKAAGSASAIGWRKLGAALLEIETITHSDGLLAAQARLPALETLIAAAHADLPETLRQDMATAAQ